jgi:hypothetical protein
MLTHPVLVLLTVGSDIDGLRVRHPEWAIGTVWATANSATDYRMLSATRDGVTVHAANAGELSARIGEQERLRGWDSSA